MPFDQSAILDVVDTLRGTDLAIAWDSTAPAGTHFQVYVDRALTWQGTARSCVVPYPGRAVRIDVGSVLATEASTDLSSELPSAPEDRVTLAWQGGTFLDSAIKGFDVYQSDAAGNPVDYTTSLATIPAYTAGVITDGWGMGGWGDGGWGRAASYYTWTSDHLTGGTWSFGVKTLDLFGNLAHTLETTAVVVAAPPPPARNAAGRRLTYTYSGASTHQVTLNWLVPNGS